MNIRYLLKTAFCISLLVGNAFSMQNLNSQLAYAIKKGDYPFFVDHLKLSVVNYRGSEGTLLRKDECTLILNEIAAEMPGGFWSLRTLAEAGDLVVGLGTVAYASRSVAVESQSEKIYSIFQKKMQQIRQPKRVVGSAESQSEEKSSTPDSSSIASASERDSAGIDSAPILSNVEQPKSRWSTYGLPGKSAVVGAFMLSIGSSLYFSITQIKRIRSLHIMAKHVLDHYEYNERLLSEKAKALVQTIKSGESKN